MKRILSSDDPVCEPLVIVELPLAVVVVALTDQVQAKRNRLTLVQMRHQSLTAKKRFVEEIGGDGGRETGY